MPFAFVQSPDWSSALDYKGSGVSAFPVAGLRLGTLVDIGFTGKVLHGVHFGLKKTKPEQTS